MLFLAWHGCLKFAKSGFPVFVAHMNSNSYFSHTCAEHRRLRYPVPSESDGNEECEEENSKHKDVAHLH
ncbi:hypothetical protein BC938DRAFT_478279 [Jimgerdemannia flammicorona]|uniref:Uncharacterized protein n=1 Tax=Jimgerdemannia flammicorona TaxID=994334 RepID=A0A433QN66_9FUNG|nr:hypothetical protein BC938DRAFT_478279 [Jimgerdemannia flammicorona]